jgi:hypothetical protein
MSIPFELARTGKPRKKRKRQINCGIGTGKHVERSIGALGMSLNIPVAMGFLGEDASLNF